MARLVSLDRKPFSFLLLRMDRFSARWPTRLDARCSTSSSSRTARRWSRLTAPHPMPASRSPSTSSCWRRLDWSSPDAGAAKSGTTSTRSRSACARPLGEQVHRALGRRPRRPQTRTGDSDGENLRDLHSHDARTPVGGDHRPGDPRQVPLRRRRGVQLGCRLAVCSWVTPRGPAPRRGRESGGGPAASPGADDARAWGERPSARGPPG